MPFICRTDLPAEVRDPHLKAYKEGIRQRLLFAATEAERKHLQRMLERADDDVPSYQADSPPPLGAIDPASFL